MGRARSAVHFTIAAAALVVLLVADPCRCDIPACYTSGVREVQFTQYWIPVEGTYDENDQGQSILLSGVPSETITLSENLQPYEVTDENTYSKCVEEGTCYLRNGALVNTGTTDETFEIVDRSIYPYGEGADGEKLLPFVSVAANDVPVGTTFLVPELQNFQLPNGRFHNGCVTVHDKGQSDFQCHIDWFVNTYADETNLRPRVLETVTTQVASCEVLQYV